MRRFGSAFVSSIAFILLAASPASPQRGSAPIQTGTIDGILLKDGILVLRSLDTTRSSTVLERGPSWLRVVEIAPRTSAVPTRTAQFVGCYLVERGEWSDSLGAMTLSFATIPADVRLHWHYLSHWGRENDLVATDGSGAIVGHRVPPPFAVSEPGARKRAAE